MALKLPKLELAHGDVAANTKACSRWFKIIAYALEKHPEGLFLKGIKVEYTALAIGQGVDPLTDDGDFRGSLSRQLLIALSMCQRIGWVSFRLEKPTSSLSTGEKPLLSPLTEHLWALTKAGARANRWSTQKLHRSIAIHMIKFGIEPMVGKLRPPLALASAAVGVSRLVLHWGDIRATVEAVIAICSALVLALFYPAKPHSNP